MVAGFLALVATAPVDARKKEAKDLAPPVQPLSTGDASGPFAATLDNLGRLWLVYSAEDVDAPPTVQLPTPLQGASELPPTVPPRKTAVRIRAQNDRFEWLEPETLSIDRPLQLRVALLAGQPVIAFSSDLGAGLLARDAKGVWSNTVLATRDERPANLALVAVEQTVAAFVVCDPKGTKKPIVRRTVLPTTGARTSDDLALDRLDGRLFSLTATTRGQLDLVFSLESASVVLRAKDGPSRTAKHLGFTRLAATRFSPVAILAASSDPLLLASTGLSAGPAILWLRQEEKRYRLYLLEGQGNFFIGPTSILDNPVAPDTIGVASFDSNVVVAVTHESKLLLKRRDNGFWDDWHQPPGSERSIGTRAVDLQLLSGSSGVARIVLKELVGTDHQIVEWVDPPRNLTP